MPENLYVRIERPLPLKDFLELAASKAQKILGVKQDLKIGFEIPRGAPFSTVPSMIPDRPPWGLYLYLEDVDESLIEAHVGSLTAESGPAPTVLYFRELRTDVSKALVTALAIAAADLLGTEILDLEHVWSNRGQTSANDFEELFACSKSERDIPSAAAKLVRKMNRR